MRYTSNTKFSMRSNIIALVFISLLFIAFLAWLGLWLIDYFTLSLFPVPDIIWLMIISAFVGTMVTFFLQQWVFKPISKLSSAMEQVAKGKFDVQLELGKHFSEIEGIYGNFNRMAKQLKSTEILKTDFISNVSHEFKTPINAIEGYATLIQGCDENDGEQYRLYADKILFNIGRLSKLVGNILLLSKVDNQSIAANVSSFRLDEQIRQAILQLEVEWTNKDIEFDVELDRAVFSGPENLMLHIWVNLIGNAVKFSPQGGLVKIRLKNKAEELLFSVSDQGPGIEKELEKQIFEKFYQGDSSHKQEGNGLGLALVKQITELVGGSVRVADQPEGCCFEVSLKK